MIVGNYSPNTVCESLYFKIFFICFRRKLLKYGSIKPAFPFKVMLLYNTLRTCLGWSTQSSIKYTQWCLLKCYVLQALVHSFLCLLARQIYYSFCVLGCHLHLTLHPGLCGYFHWKHPWTLYPSGYQDTFTSWFTVAYREWVVLGLPLALTPYLAHSPILSSFPLWQIGVPLQDTPVIELAKRFLLTKKQTRH